MVRRNRDRMNQCAADIQAQLQRCGIERLTEYDRFARGDAVNVDRSGGRSGTVLWINRTANGRVYADVLLFMKPVRGGVAPVEYRSFDLDRLRKIRQPGEEAVGRARRLAETDREWAAAAERLSR